LRASPKNVKLASGNDTLAVQWSDGHLSVYPYRYLRDKCPCANCSELGVRTPAADNPFPMFGAKPLKPERAELVGCYALQIYWSDGHSVGIYSFDYLREVCPCPDCTAKRKEALNS